GAAGDVQVVGFQQRAPVDAGHVPTLGRRQCRRVSPGPTPHIAPSQTGYPTRTQNVTLTLSHSAAAITTPFYLSCVAPVEEPPACRRPSQTFRRDQRRDTAGVKAARGARS